MRTTTRIARGRHRRQRDGECSILSAAATIRLRLWRANLERLPAGLYGAGRRSVGG